MSDRNAAEHGPIANDVPLPLDESVISVDGAEKDDNAEPSRRSADPWEAASDSTSSPFQARRRADIFFLWVFLTDFFRAERLEKDKGHFQDSYHKNRGDQFLYFFVIFFDIFIFIFV